MDIAIANVADAVAIVLAVIGVLVFLTNVIVEVLKKITWAKIPTEILAVVVAMVLTLLALFAIAAYKSIQIQWYYIAAAVVMGFLVAYAAIYGFDKLRAMMIRIRDQATGKQLE